MPNVSDVRPKIWEDIIDLYDDGQYSAIWGNREQSERRELGVRWNGQNGYVGYPNQGKNPVWYSEPVFLQRPILLALLDRVNSNTQDSNSEFFIRNILTALSECR